MKLWNFSIQKISTREVNRTSFILWLSKINHLAKNNSKLREEMYHDSIGLFKWGKWIPINAVSGVDRGGVSNPPTGKIVVEKVCNFQTLFFAINFSKNSIFLLNFLQNFLKKFPTNCAFRPNAQKFNALFWNFFEK